MVTPRAFFPLAAVLLAAAAPTPVQVPASFALAIMGHTVDGPNGKDIARLVDVLVDAAGQPIAAVIDFGGFLGVGNRRIAVDWKSLRFAPADKDHLITLDMSLDQIKAAPDYKEAQSAPVMTQGDTTPGPPPAGAAPAALAAPAASPEPPTTPTPAGAPAPQTPAATPSVVLTPTPTLVPTPNSGPYPDSSPDLNSTPGPRSQPDDSTDPGPYPEACTSTAVARSHAAKNRVGGRWLWLAACARSIS